MQLLTWRMAERCDPIDDADTVGLIGDEAMDMALIFGRRRRQKIQPVRQQPFAGFLFVKCVSLHKTLNVCYNFKSMDFQP
ncbi:hypothetical protein DM860_014362 [Cuscuta australis]|uniref:Uncharacterized protein n=1 Tax=Cuscuta australis TaxID=267555 RepID=A0A328DI92_9ASTE|nr:hypothetical protein DM860_014362 [Cuscuta australis]